MTICDKLQKFARAREHAYRSSNALTGTKARAISKILMMASMFQFRKGEQQRTAVKNCIPELMQILPHQESRFSKQRKEILTLIRNYDPGPDSSPTS
jgi:hypothetical protein